MIMTSEYGNFFLAARNRTLGPTFSIQKEKGLYSSHSLPLLLLSLYAKVLDCHVHQITLTYNC